MLQCMLQEVTKFNDMDWGMTPHHSQSQRNSSKDKNPIEIPNSDVCGLLIAILDSGESQ